MRIFISEYLCSGAWAEPVIPGSLSREGKAMLTAVVEDFLRLEPPDSISVVTTWDPRLGSHPFSELKNIDVRIASSPAEERQLFCSIAKECDTALVIAPEFENQLFERCELLRSSGLKLLNSSASAINLCSDKLQFETFCRGRNVFTIPTKLLQDIDHWDEQHNQSFVLKMRYGAGSCGMQRFHSLSDLRDASRHLDATNFLIQPYIAGKSYSVAAFFEDNEINVLATAEQHFHSESTFAYCGGRIPASHAESHSIEFTNKFRGIGLNGYVGFDFLIPKEQADQPVLVEINPRLTTSYVGYRAAYTNDNLAKRWFSNGLHLKPELIHDVTFQADGSILNKQRLV